MFKKIFILFSCLLVISSCSHNSNNNSKKELNKREIIQKHIKSYKVPIKENPNVQLW